MPKKNSEKSRKSEKLSERERERYSRNLLLKEWNGDEGQLKLKNATVLVVGAGGSGSPLLYYLAAAGVGTIRICDGDTVALDNLNRQILHNESRIGMNKALSAKKTLEELNSDIEIIAYDAYMDKDNISGMAEGCDLICSAADDRKDREAWMVMNRWSYEKKVPVIWGGANNMGGVISFIQPPATPCIECILAHSDAALEAIKSGSVEKPADVGMPVEGPNPIVGAAAGAAGAMQALEAIRYLVGIGRNLTGMMFLFQMAEDITLNIYDIDKEIRRPECPYCGKQQ